MNKYGPGRVHLDFDKHLSGERTLDGCTRSDFETRVIRVAD